MKWSQVKVRHLPQIQKLIDYKSEDIVEIYDRDVALLSIITGKSEDYFGSLSPKKFGEYRKELYELISTQPTTEFNPVFTIGGRKFSTVISAKQATMDQVADIHLLDITPKNYYEYLPYILATFAKEKRGLRLWRKPLSFTAKVELFKDLPADIANSISLFFCKVSKPLEKAILNSLENQIKDRVNNLTATLKQLSTDGDGLQLSTNSPTAIKRRKRNTSK